MRNAVLGCCAILFLSACAANNTGISMDSANEHVVLSNAELATILSFGNSRVISLPEGLQGEVTVINNHETDQALQYRFNWYDLQGLEVDNMALPWRYLLIRGKDSVKLKDIPQNTADNRAVHFRVSIKQAKK